jgi:hypothetical protein
MSSSRRTNKMKVSIFLTLMRAMSAVGDMGLGVTAKEHAIVVFLADKGHHVRGYSRVLFTEANKSKKWLRMHEDGCGENEKEVELNSLAPLCWNLRGELNTAVLAVLEHNFNNHELYGDWCV